MIISKEFDFDMSHRLEGYNGLCKSIHGHTYKLIVSLDINKLDALGMCVDFKVLKEVVKENIIKYVDHSIWLKQSVKNDKLIKLLIKEKNRLLLTPYNSTAENMALTFWHILSKKLPLFTLTVYETATSKITINRDNYEKMKKGIINFEFFGED